MHWLTAQCSDGHPSTHAPACPQYLKRCLQVEHGLFSKPDRSCPSSLTGPGINLLHPISNGGSFTTPALQTGTHFYACPVRKFRSPC